MRQASAWKVGFVAALLCGCESSSSPDASGTTSGAGGTGGGPPACTADLGSDPLNCGACGHSCGGATCAEGLCQPVKLVDSVQGDGLAVDDAWLYGTDDELNRVFKISNTGGMETTLASAQGVPNSPVVNASGLYWCNFRSGEVMRLGPGDAEPTALATMQYAPRGLFVDATHAYFTIPGGGILGMGGIVTRVPVTGGDVEDLVKQIFDPYGFTGDETNLYWTDMGGDTTLAKGRVVSMPKGGGPIRVLATDQKLPGHLQVDATYVYWLNEGTPYEAEEDGGVFRVAKTGGAVETIAYPERMAVDLVVDGHDAYWITKFSVVRRAPITGGARQTLFSNGDLPPFVALAQDAEALYYSTDGSSSLSEAALWKLAKPVPSVTAPRPDGGAAPDASGGPPKPDAEVPRMDASGMLDATPDRPNPINDAPVACGAIGAGCFSSGSCCRDLICLTVGTDPPRCCTPIGGSCTKESDCCGNGLSCVDGKCCGTSYLGCSATNCCTSIGYYCNPGNYCSLRPDSGGM